MDPLAPKIGNFHIQAVMTIRPEGGWVPDVSVRTSAALAAAPLGSSMLSPKLGPRVRPCDFAVTVPDGTDADDGCSTTAVLPTVRPVPLNLSPEEEDDFPKQFPMVFGNQLSIRVERSLVVQNCRTLMILYFFRQSRYGKQLFRYQSTE